MATLLNNTLPKTNVMFTCSAYNRMLHAWTMIRDCLEGSKAIKLQGDKYLPRPNSCDKSTEGNARYEQYKQRAVFYNATARTLNGLVGQVFAKPTILNLDKDRYRYLIANADGSGVSLLQLLKQAERYTMAYGRAGLLVDYTSTTGATVSEAAEGTSRAIIRLYQALNIINWRLDDLGKPYLIVLKESIEIDLNDSFGTKEVIQYRVLALEFAGTDEQRAVVGLFQANGDPDVRGWSILYDAKGEELKELPFFFIGSENNDPLPDTPPMYDLAELNIAHYINSADHEEACHMVSQPTPVATGISENWATKFLNGSVKLGSRSVVPLPVNATITLLQAQETTMASEGMEAKEKQMVALGAKLVERRTVEATATEINADEAASMSILSSCTSNVEAAMNAALDLVAKLEGFPPTPNALVMNKDFDITRMSAGDRAQLLSEFSAGLVSFTETRRLMRAGGFSLDDNDETVQAQIKANPPLAITVELEKTKKTGNEPA